MDVAPGSVRKTFDGVGYLGFHLRFQVLNFFSLIHDCTRFQKVSLFFVAVLGVW